MSSNILKRPYNGLPVHQNGKKSLRLDLWSGVKNFFNSAANKVREALPKSKKVMLEETLAGHNKRQGAPKTKQPNDGLDPESEHFSFSGSSVSDESNNKRPLRSPEVIAHTRTMQRGLDGVGVRVGYGINKAIEGEYEALKKSLEEPSSVENPKVKNEKKLDELNTKKQPIIQNPLAEQYAETMRGMPEPANSLMQKTQCAYGI